MAKRQRPPLSPDGLYAVILAAGASSRLAAPKQLISFKRQTLLGRTANLAEHCFSNQVIVVLGAHAHRLRRELVGRCCRVAVNIQWRTGIASSIVAGIRALPPACPGALIMLCDQPLISATHLRSMIATWMRNKSRIVAAAYEMTLGVPAIFPQPCFKLLKQLKGDVGARRLLRDALEIALPVPIPEAALDVDTKQDLSKLARMRPLSTELVPSVVEYPADNPLSEKCSLCRATRGLTCRRRARAWRARRHAHLSRGTDNRPGHCAHRESGRARLAACALAW